MIEILPNWHPVFVHFTIALLSMAVVFYLLKTILPAHNKYQVALNILAKSNLLIGTGFAILTAIAGWFAYNSVAHDTPSHLAMTTHRNWALITLAFFIVLALWSLWQKHKTTLLFLLAMLIAGGLLATTGWLGAEAVYRYGLGVQSLPKSSGEGHAHHHADGEGHGTKDNEAKDKANKALANKTHSEMQSPDEHEHEDEHKHEDEHEHADSTVKSIPKKEEETAKKSHNETPHTH